jgi:hypothetical protein
MMNMLRSTFALTFTLALATGVALAQNDAPSQNYAPPQGYTLAQGAQINAVMNDPLDSSLANVGDRFSMHVVGPYPNNDPRFEGATITGKVLSVQRAGQGVKPQLQLGINRLIFADGSSVQLDAQVTSEQTKQQQKSGAKVALSTIGGMLLGNLVGKTVFHTGGGGLVGAAGGFLYGYNNNTNITLPAGAPIQLTVARDIVIRQQSGP